MADMTDVKIRLNFWRSAYEKLTAAYTALVDGRVKSYTIDDRQLTRFDPVSYTHLRAHET